MRKCVQTYDCYCIPLWQVSPSVLHEPMRGFHVCINVLPVGEVELTTVVTLKSCDGSDRLSMCFTQTLWPTREWEDWPLVGCSMRWMEWLHLRPEYFLWPPTLLTGTVVRFSNTSFIMCVVVQQKKKKQPIYTKQRIWMLRQFYQSDVPLCKS